MPLRFHDAEKRVMVAAGISRDLIRKWETGKTPGKRNAVLIATVTGREVIDLLFGRNPKDGRVVA